MLLYFHDKVDSLMNYHVKKEKKTSYHTQDDNNLFLNLFLQF